ncbi:pilus assembly protein PilZ, partial [Burkholderia cenocepacia]|nr:pilus assembly protein PilZ [Burkholderia cenocepacia]
MLARDDLSAEIPLGFDLYDADGAALLPAGPTPPDPAQPAFLFAHFPPPRRPAAADTGPRGPPPAAAPATRIG